MPLFFRALNQKKQLPLLERADECIYTMACKSCENEPTVVTLATRVNLVFKWLNGKENHFWPSINEKIQIVWLDLRLKTIIGVRYEDSYNLGDASDRHQTFWVVGPLICKVFVVRILPDHWPPSLF